MQKLVDSPGAPLRWNVQKMDADKFAEKLARRGVMLKVLDQNGRGSAKALVTFTTNATLRASEALSQGQISSWEAFCVLVNLRNPDMWRKCLSLRRIVLKRMSE